MTLAARCYPPNACIEMRVPCAWSPQPPCCPTCKQELRVLHCCGRAFRPVPSPFALPQPHRHQVAPSCEEVARRLGDTERALKISGWYYGNLDWQAAQTLLKDAGAGAFLIRNSGDKNFKFSLSVQTERGPTSVRLVYDKMYGYFRLDSDWSMAKYMPRFRCVVDMAAHYTRRRTPGTMWVDRDGHAHSPVLLSTPLRQSPPSLLHAARLAVHKAIDRSVASNPFSLNLKTAPQYKKLPLPPALLDYLGEYPYSI